MARRPTIATRLALITMLGACSSAPERTDTQVTTDPADDGMKGDGAQDGDTGQGDGSKDGDDDGDDGFDPPGSCTIKRAVYFGTTAPTSVVLSAGQIKAIGRFDVGGGLCSGTLVTRDWVLTAKHCTEGQRASGMVFAVGADPANPDREYVVSEKAEHPQRDSALVRLTSSPLDDDPSIVPIRINDESLDQRIGDIFEGAGYGETERGRTGTRYFTAEPLVELDDELASVDGEGRHGLCGGDSGGPLLGTFADGTRVVGGLFYGDTSCVGVDSYTRTDTIADWIGGVIGPLDSCGDVDARGSCDGQVATYCAGGSVRSDRCADMGLVCGLDAAAGGFRCLPDTSCGDLTAAGECDGSIARWCEGDARQEQNCAASGLVCGASNGEQRCIADPCAGIPAEGTCVGDTATVCLGQSREEVDCTRCGQVCAVGASGVECVDED